MQESIKNHGEPKKQESDYLSPKELAIKLNVPLRTIETWTQARRVPGQVKLGRLWRYRKSEVEKAQFRGQLLLEKPKKQPLENIGRIKFKSPAQGTHCSKGVWQ